MQSNSDNCKEYKQRVKLKAMELLGGAKCKICGFDDIRALQIDHLKTVTIKQGNYGRGSTGLYVAIIKGTVNLEDYQVLCANHNWIKRMEHENHLCVKNVQYVNR